MSRHLFITVCGAALLAIGPASAQTIQSEPPAATPPSLQSPPAGPRSYPAPDQPDTGRVMPAPDSPTGVGPDRTDLGRDCGRARTRVQQTICKNSDLVQLDGDVAQLAGTLPGGANQGAWVQQLESCEATATTVYDGPIYRCLSARYKARLVQLSRMAGGTLSGQYRMTGRPGDGSMTVVEYPDGRASVVFDMITAAGARACGTRMDAHISQGRIEGSPQGLPGCRVAIQIGSGGTAQVQSNGCTSLCEMGERVDGSYLSLGAVAPAARPSRTPQRTPAAPRTNPRY